MHLKRKSHYALFLLIFFVFFGQKILLILINQFGSLSDSRFVTIPLKVFLVILLIFLFIIRKKLKGNLSSFFIFLFFCGIFILRILYDISQNAFAGYYLDGYEAMQYFIISIVLPGLCLILISYSAYDYKVIWYALIISGLLFSGAAILKYSKFLGTVGRLTAATADEDVLSPLILSYCGALGIGLGILMISQWYNLRKRSVGLILIGLSIIPFFLGSSRGSLMALFIPILFIFLFNSNNKSKVQYLILSIVGMLLVFYLSDYLNSNIIDRFQKVGIQDTGTLDSREMRWHQAILQFEASPIFGDGLVLNGFNNYPHNIILETFMATGLLGGIPFLVLLYIALRKTILIVKNHPELYWLAVLFLQALIQNMFSGSIVSATWFASSLALILATNFQRKQKLC